MHISAQLCTNSLLPSLQMESESCFQLDQFESLLLPENNRPLENSVLLALKELFNRSDPKTIALHILSVDCQVTPVFTLNSFRTPRTPLNLRMVSNLKHFD